MYIERGPDDTFSIGSNFIDSAVEKAFGTHFPTKIVGFSEAKQLRTIVANLSGDLTQKMRDDDQADQIMSHIRVQVHENAIPDDGRIDFDFSGVKHVEIVGGESGGVGADVVDTGNPPPFLVGMIDGCCLKGRPPLRAGELRQHLESRKFRSKETRFVSLTTDLETQQFIDSSKLKSVQERVDAFHLDDEKLEKIFAKSSDQNLIIMGHVEEDRFVVKSPSDQTGFTVTFSKIDELAKKHNVQTIYLGCHSADELNTQWGGVGVVEAFKTLDAARRLEVAYAQSRTMKDFLRELSADGMTVIVDQNAFQNESKITAGIYANIDGEDVRVAELGYVGNSIGWFKWLISSARDAFSSN